MSLPFRKSTIFIGSCTKPHHSPTRSTWVIGTHAIQRIVAPGGL